MKKLLDAKTRLAISQRLVSETFDEVERLDAALADVVARIRRSREAVDTSRALLRGLQVRELGQKAAVKIQAETLPELHPGVSPPQI